MKKLREKSNLIFFILIITPTLLFFFINCENKDDVNNPNLQNNYVTLEHNEFMKLSNDKIADSLAVILDVSPVTYNQVVSIGMLFHDNLKWAVKEGYEYIANNGAKITIWVDDNNNPYYVTYLLKRGGTSSSWTCEQELVISDFISNIEKSGGNLTGSENIVINKMNIYGHYHELYLTQSYNDTCVNFPYFFSEVEGDTNKVNLLLINRWYNNLNDIKNTVSDEILREKAREYFEASEKVISIRDELTINGYYIIKNKLCRKVGSALIDEWGSTLDLYVDIQNGEIVEETELHVG